MVILPSTALSKLTVSLRSLIWLHRVPKTDITLVMILFSVFASWTISDYGMRIPISGKKRKKGKIYYVLAHKAWGRGRQGPWRNPTLHSVIHLKLPHTPVVVWRTYQRRYAASPIAAHPPILLWRNEDERRVMVWRRYWGSVIYMAIRSDVVW